MAAKSKSKPKTTAPAKKASVPATPAASRPRNTPPQLTGIFQPGFWRDQWMPALILVVLAFVLYGASLSFGYVLDDQMVIWENAFVQKGFAGLRDIFAFDSFMGYFQKQEQLFLLEGGRYRPLSLATFAMEVGIFGKDNAHLAHVSHFVNILLYGLTGVLLYRILLGLFPLKEGGRWYFGMPFLAALIFMLHPLHSECVANIKGRDEILALLCSLAALWATLKYFDTNKGLFLGLSGLFLFLGLLSKENALTFLAVIPVTVWFFCPAPGLKGRMFTAFAPLLAATFLFIIIRYRALGFMLDHGKAVNDLMDDPFLGMNAGEKSATIFLTLGWYLKLLFYPPSAHARLLSLPRSESKLVGLAGARVAGLVPRHGCVGDAQPAQTQRSGLQHRVLAADPEHRIQPVRIGGYFYERAFRIYAFGGVLHFHRMAGKPQTARMAQGTTRPARHSDGGHHNTDGGSLLCALRACPTGKTPCR